MRTRVSPEMLPPASSAKRDNHKVVGSSTNASATVPAIAPDQIHRARRERRPPSAATAAVVSPNSAATKPIRENDNKMAANIVVAVTSRLQPTR